MNKKGFIEFSRTTIIVSIIVIVLLILGMVLVKFVFVDDDSDKMDNSFMHTETNQSLFIPEDGSVAISPSEITLTQGDVATAKFLIKNLGISAISGVYAEVKTMAFDDAIAESLVCTFSDTSTSKSNTYNLGPDQIMYGLNILVEDRGSDLGTYACVITVYNLSDSVEIRSLIINLEK